MFSSLILTLLLSVTAVSIVDSTCPLVNPVPQCQCKTLKDQAKQEFSILTCSNLHSEDALKTVLATTRGFPMFELELVDCSLRYLPHDAFVGTTFEVLSIRNSSLHSLSDTNVAFVGLEKQMHLLEIINCSYTSDWDWTQLSNLVHLMEIHVSESELIDITEGISRIQHIDVEAFMFQKNHIQELDNKAFAPFSNLERLFLDNNYIRRLSRAMFPKPAKLLKIIGLSYNTLADLPDDLFMDMPALASLYLTGNPLHIIDEVVFKPIWNQLRLFFFYGTNLSCDCRMTWLTKFDNSRKFLHAECQGPTSFKGRDIKTISSDELWC